MKILLAVTDTEVGGITTAAVNFSNEMSRHGLEVYFLDMCGHTDENFLSDPKIRIVHIRGKSKYWNITVKNSNNLPFWMHWLLGAIKKITVRSGLWYKMIFNRFTDCGDFDVAIAFRQCAPCYSFVLNKVNAKKKMGFVHGELTFMGDISSWQKYMKEFDLIAYVSNAVRKQFTDSYPEICKKACTVYNMLAVEKVNRMAQEVPAVVPDPSVKNIVTVARIDNTFKQTHWIVAICEKMKEQTTIPFHWYVLGDGLDFNNMIGLVKERHLEDVLTFTGNQSNPYAIVKNSDFTVLTSKSEAFGLVIAESFILKKPVVATRYSALTEIMEDGKHGLIAEQSPDGVYDCVLKMLQNENNVFNNCRDFLNTYEYSNETAYKQFCNALNRGDRI